MTGLGVFAADPRLKRSVIAMLQENNHGFPDAREAPDTNARTVAKREIA